MNLAAWEALGTMALGVAVDLSFVWWSRSTQKLDMWGAVFAAALIQIFGVVGLLIVVNDPTMIAANVAGHAVGSGLGVRLAQENKS